MLSCDSSLNFYSYFEYAHPCFPILDAFSSWDQSPKLRKHPRPDPIYACNVAVAALQEDFNESSVSTILCSVLDMIGRPVSLDVHPRDRLLIFHTDQLHRGQHHQ